MRLDPELVRNRIVKYPGATFSEQEGQYFITVDDSVLTRDSLYDLWEMFKRYNKKKLRNKDYNYIFPIEQSQTTDEDKVDHEDYFHDFSTNLHRRIEITYNLYNKHNATISGYIRKLDPNMLTILVDSVFRYISFDSIIKYKYIR